MRKDIINEANFALPTAIRRVSIAVFIRTATLIRMMLKL